MGYNSYNRLWKSKFDNIVSKRDKLQDMNFNQLKLEVHETYKKDENTTTKFLAVNDEDVINTGYLDEKTKKLMAIYRFEKKITANLIYNTIDNQLKIF